MDIINLIMHTNESEHNFLTVLSAWGKAEGRHQTVNK